MKIVANKLVEQVMSAKRDKAAVLHYLQYNICSTEFVSIKLFSEFKCIGYIAG